MIKISPFRMGCLFITQQRGNNPLPYRKKRLKRKIEPRHPEVLKTLRFQAVGSIN